jgi:hypothetical protein
MKRRAFLKKSAGITAMGLGLGFIGGMTFSSSVPIVINSP